MILVADGGSTKTEWRTVEEGKSGAPIFSAGINPYFLSSGEIYQLISNDFESLSGRLPEKIWFYGTGCNSDQNHAIIQHLLQSHNLA